VNFRAVRLNERTKRTFLSRSGDNDPAGLLTRTRNSGMGRRRFLLLLLDENPPPGFVPRLNALAREKFHGKKRKKMERGQAERARVG